MVLNLKSIPKYISNFKEKYGIMPSVIGGSFGIAMAALALSPGPCRTSNLVQDRYYQLLAQYGNNNHDNNISPEEKRAFDQELFSGKEVNYIPWEEPASELTSRLASSAPVTEPASGRVTSSKHTGCKWDAYVPQPRYVADGKQVPLETMLEWMAKYDMNQRAHR